MDVVEMLARATEQPKDALNDVEFLSEVNGWDSLAVLNFMALVNKSYGITLSAETLLACESVQDVENLLNGKMPVEKM